MKKIVLLVLLSSLFIVNASELKVAAGAGYKKPLMEVIKEYKKSGKNVDALFGNMKQISTQAKQTDIPIIIGDKEFLSKKSGLDFENFVQLGVGKVVLAYSKNKEIKEINNLQESSIKKISMPEPKKAIYGIAGLEFLKNSNLFEKIENKLLIVSTVPQSVAYLISNEVDVSIINLTAALANEDKIAGFLEVPQKYYSPINIVAGELKNCNNECKEFLNFLTNDTSKNIFKKYGL